MVLARPVICVGWKRMDQKSVRTQNESDERLMAVTISSDRGEAAQ